jgi:hypothetical protein
VGLDLAQPVEPPRQRIGVVVGIDQQDFCVIARASEREIQRGDAAVVVADRRAVTATTGMALGDARRGSFARMPRTLSRNAEGAVPVRRVGQPRRVTSARVRRRKNAAQRAQHHHSIPLAVATGRHPRRRMPPCSHQP